MRYITPLKAAEGLGAAHEGTQHHWAMTVSAVALAVLTPLFMIVIACAIGLPQELLVVYFARPLPAIITRAPRPLRRLHRRRHRWSRPHSWCASIATDQPRRPSE